MVAHSSDIVVVNIMRVFGTYEYLVLKPGAQYSPVNRNMNARALSY